MNKGLVKTSIIALISGIILNLIIPIGLLLVFNLVLSLATLLDPLFAGKRLEMIWTYFILLTIGQTFFAVFASLATNFSIYFLIQKINSVWVYAVGIVSGLAIHWILLFILLAIVFLAFGEDVFAIWGIFSFIVVSLASPLISLLSVGFGRTYLAESILETGSI